MSEQPALRRFTVNGGGAYPELAEEHPGLFLGFGAHEVEEIAPGHWRLVTSDAQDDAPQDVTPAVESAPEPEASPAEEAQAPAEPVLAEREADSVGQAEPAADEPPAADADEEPQDDTAPDTPASPPAAKETPDTPED